MNKVKSDHMVANWRMGRERETAGEEPVQKTEKYVRQKWGNEWEKQKE